MVVTGSWDSPTKKPTEVENWIETHNLCKAKYFTRFFANVISGDHHLVNIQVVFAPGVPSNQVPLSPSQTLGPTFCFLLADNSVPDINISDETNHAVALLFKAAFIKSIARIHLSVNHLVPIEKNPHCTVLVGKGDTDVVPQPRWPDGKALSQRVVSIKTKCLHLVGELPEYLTKGIFAANIFPQSDWTKCK